MEWVKVIRGSFSQPTTDTHSPSWVGTESEKPVKRERVQTGGKWFWIKEIWLGWSTIAGNCEKKMLEWRIRYIKKTKQNMCMRTVLQLYQCVEGGHGEDAQSSHGQLGGSWGKTQQAFRVRWLAALQTGQVAAAAEQIHVKLLQVLLPQEDLQQNERGVWDQWKGWISCCVTEANVSFWSEPDLSNRQTQRKTTTGEKTNVPLKIRVVEDNPGHFQEELDVGVTKLPEGCITH